MKRIYGTREIGKTYRDYDLATPSKLKAAAIQEAKETGHTHTDDINAYLILSLSCQLADALNRLNKDSVPPLTDCIG